jgi:hypothetical protein
MWIRIQEPIGCRSGFETRVKRLRQTSAFERLFFFLFRKQPRKDLSQPHLNLPPKNLGFLGRLFSRVQWFCNFDMPVNQGCVMCIWIDSVRSWIRIHKIIESGSNAYPDPDPQQNFWEQIFVPSVEVKILLICTILYCILKLLKWPKCTKPKKYRYIFILVILLTLNLDPQNHWIRIRSGFGSTTLLLTDLNCGKGLKSDPDSDPQPCF